MGSTPSRFSPSRLKRPVSQIPKEQNDFYPGYSFHSDEVIIAISKAIYMEIKSRAVGDCIFVLILRFYLGLRIG